MQIARNTLAFQADCKHTCWTAVGGRIRWSRCKKCRLWSARPTLQCRAQWEETRFQKFTLQSFKLDLSYSSLDLVDEMLAFQNIFVSAFWKAVPFAPSFNTKTHKKLKTSWKKKNIHVSYVLDSTPRSPRCLQRLAARWGAPRRCSTFPRSRRNTRPRSA